MSRIILIFLLAAVSSNAMAEWAKFGTVIDGNITFYADPTTIRKNGEMVRMWVLQDYLTAQSGRHYLSAKSQSEYDCKKKYVRPISISLHSGNMGSGEIIEISTARDDAWIPVPPDTMFENLWKFACDKK
jgi:hypothetical protein